MTWGPFESGLETAEVQARLRALRVAVRLVAGPRGLDCRHRLLVATFDPDQGTLAEAAAAFERLSALDRRRVLSAMAAEAVETVEARKAGDPGGSNSIRVGEAQFIASARGPKPVRRPRCRADGGADTLLLPRRGRR